MGWRSIDIRCEDKECAAVWDELVDMAELDNVFECKVCKGPAKRTISAPMVLKASYPDGMKRSGWAEMREQSKLETIVRSKQASKEDKTAAQKEIKEIFTTTKKVG